MQQIGRIDERTDRSDAQPHFFEGQLLSPEELNRIAEFATSRQAAATRLVVGSGGILRGVGEEFAVMPASGESLEIRVLTGAAIGRDGYLMATHEETTLDLADLRPISEEDAHNRTVYILLKRKSTLEGHTVDKELQNVEGFREKRLGCTIVIADKPSHEPESLELARVLLNSATKTLENVRPGEQAIKPGQINLQHRAYLGQLGGLHLTEKERQSYLDRLENLRLIIERSTQIFQVKPLSLFDFYLHQLRCEFYRCNVDTNFVDRIVDDVLPMIAYLLEDIRQIVGENRQRGDERILTVDELLKRVSEAKASLSFIQKLERLLAIGEFFNTKLLGNTHKNAVALRINHALKAIRHQPFRPERSIAPGGIVFGLCDKIEPKSAEGRVQTNAFLKEQMTVRGKFGRQAAKLTALAVQGASLDVNLGALQTNKDLLILTVGYKRRQDIEIECFYNGKSVHLEMTSDADAENGFFTYGWVIPAAMVTAADSQLRLTAHKYELNFPFFGIYLYQ